MKRVLVVDDSPSVRELLVHILGSDPGIEVAGCAADGEQALRMAIDHNPDVITMDLHMPGMDGFEATRRIMQTCPVPIVIVSGSEDAAEMGSSFHAIEAGALTVVRRPFGLGHPAYARTAQALVRTVKTMAEVKVVRRWPAGVQSAPRTSGSGTAVQQRRLVVLGASTGGPAALRDILAQLRPGYPMPLVIVQHMAPGFAGGLATWLSGASGFAVGIAAHRERLEAGRAYLAPDGYQIGLTREFEVELIRAGPEHGMCPAVSHLFRSVHADLRAATVAVLLTGMGKDGGLELRQLRDGGAITIVQDRASSAVYGMPGEALRHDAAMLVLAPVAIGKTLHAIGAHCASGSSFLGI